VNGSQKVDVAALLQRRASRSVVVVVLTLLIAAGAGIVWGLPGFFALAGIIYLAFPVVLALDRASAALYQLSFIQKLLLVIVGTVTLFAATLPKEIAFPIVIASSGIWSSIVLDARKAHVIGRSRAILRRTPAARQCEGERCEDDREES
jgi:hypothetical protein